MKTIKKNYDDVPSCSKILKCSEQFRKYFCKISVRKEGKKYKQVLITIEQRPSPSSVYSTNMEEDTIHTDYKYINEKLSENILPFNTNLGYHILTNREHSSSLLLFSQLHKGPHSIYHFLTQLFNSLKQELSSLILFLMPRK